MFLERFYRITSLEKSFVATDGISEAPVLEIRNGQQSALFVASFERHDHPYKVEIVLHLYGEISDIVVDKLFCRYSGAVFRQNLGETGRFVPFKTWYKDLFVGHDVVRYALVALPYRLVLVLGKRVEFLEQGHDFLLMAPDVSVGILGPILSLLRLGFWHRDPCTRYMGSRRKYLFHLFYVDSVLGLFRE